MGGERPPCPPAGRSGRELLNCTVEDVAILVSAGKLHALGKPRPNAVKLFSTVELIALLADREWLDDATKTIGQYWKRKNARRHGVAEDHQADVTQVAGKNQVAL